MQYSKNFYQIKPSETIFNGLKQEMEHIGYYKLPFANISDIKKFAKSVKQKYIAVIGIGGSSLGTFAIYDFLKRTYNYNKFLHFFDTTDPVDINSKIKKLDLKDTLFIVISKSGTTIETISIFKYLHTKININNSNCIIISEVKSDLTNYAKQNNMKTFEVEIFTEFEGNIAGYEVQSDNFEEVLAEAQNDVSEYDSFCIAVGDTLYWDSQMSDEWNRDWMKKLEL